MGEATLEKIISEIIGWLNDHSNNLDNSIISIQPETELIVEGIFDSIKILEFVAWLEERFQIIIGVEKMTPDFFKSPKTIAEQVKQLVP